MHDIMDFPKNITKKVVAKILRNLLFCLAQEIKEKIKTYHSNAFKSIY